MTPFSFARSCPRLCVRICDAIALKRVVRPRKRKRERERKRPLTLGVTSFRLVRLHVIIPCAHTLQLPAARRSQQPLWNLRAGRGCNTYPLTLAVGRVLSRLRGVVS